MGVWSAENAVNNAIGQSARRERQERLKREDRQAAAQVAGRGKRQV